MAFGYIYIYTPLSLSSCFETNSIESSEIKPNYNYPHRHMSSNNRSKKTATDSESKSSASSSEEELPDTSPEDARKNKTATLIQRLDTLDSKIFAISEDLDTIKICVQTIHACHNQNEERTSKSFRSLEAHLDKLEVIIDHNHKHLHRLQDAVEELQEQDLLWDAWENLEKDIEGINERIANKFGKLEKSQRKGLEGIVERLDRMDRKLDAKQGDTVE